MISCYNGYTSILAAYLSMELFVSTIMVKLNTHQSQRDLSEFKAQSFLRLTCNIGKIVQVLILREKIFPPKSDEGPSKAMSSHELLFEICTVRYKERRYVHCEPF